MNSPSKTNTMNKLSLIALLICFCSSVFGSVRQSQDSIRQKRIAVAKYVLDAVKEDSINTSTIFNRVFDQNLGGYPPDKGYDDWLNLYLSQWIDTLSEEDIKEISILDKRILCHKVYFQHLRERLKEVAPEDIQIIPYASVKDPKSLSSGNTVHEDEVENTYVITYPYLGARKAEYVLYNNEDKVQAIAHIVWAPGEAISGVTFL